MSRFRRLRATLNRLIIRRGFPADGYLILVAAVIGVSGGLVATGFGWMVEASVHFFFSGFDSDGAQLTSYAQLLGIPVLGGLVVGLLTWWLARDAEGHGVPQVIESLARHQGFMRLRVGAVKMVSSALTIGTGGSAGVEGPIIQIGAVVGSVTGQVIHLSRKHLQVLVGCGAAAGMAAIFNAPIAAVMFVMEVLLRDFSLKTFTPVIIASVVGTATAQAIHGRNEALFTLPAAIEQYSYTLGELGFYAVLGLLSGLVGVAFIRLLDSGEQWWGGARVPRWARPAFGGLGLGLIGCAYFALAPRLEVGHGMPPFYANGYPMIEALFDPAFYREDGGGTITVLLFILLAKLVGTTLTLGSGGSGGILAPSLFLGATLGGIFGMLLPQGVSWAPGLTPATYALAGMAGVLAAVAHAPLTAFLLIFELTRDYKVILPVMLVSILAMTVSQLLFPDSIYSVALRRRGIRHGSRSDMMLLRRLSVSEVPLVPAVSVHPEDPAQRLIELAEQYAVSDFVVLDEQDHYLGMVVGDDLRTTLLQREAIPLMIVAELMREGFPGVSADQTLDRVLDRFSENDVSSLPVLDDEGGVTGLITRSRLMRRYHQAIEAD